MSSELPFNSALLAEHFTPLTPDLPDNGEPGYWLLLQGTTLLLPLSTAAQQLPVENVAAQLNATAPLVIGLWQGKPLRAVVLAPDESAPAGYVALPFQGPDMQLDNTLATLAGRAAQILHWERRSRFCSHCGATLARIPGGWGKRCAACGDEHFPHIHPCIIVLVRRGAELLLIRNAAWNPGRFSLVAGFLDFGESLEECLRREVREEAGIEVTKIRYVGSQSWPFPSQVMLGYLAEYAGGEVKPDGVEVVEAYWFKDDQLPAAPGSRRSIARWIFETYATPAL